MRFLQEGAGEAGQAGSGLASVNHFSELDVSLLVWYLPWGDCENLIREVIGDVDLMDSRGRTGQPLVTISNLGQDRSLKNYFKQSKTIPQFHYISMLKYF